MVSMPKIPGDVLDGSDGIVGIGKQDLEPLACRRDIFQSFENMGARERGMQADCVGMKEPLL